MNPRGIQGDAIYYDANGNEDFAPDFYYDTAARITRRGWTAEMRIPFSSLRYPSADPQTLGPPALAQLPPGVPLPDLLEPPPPQLQLPALPLHRGRGAREAAPLAAPGGWRPT